MTLEIMGSLCPVYPSPTYVQHNCQCAIQILVDVNFKLRLYDSKVQLVILICLSFNALSCKIHICFCHRLLIIEGLIGDSLIPCHNGKARTSESFDKKTVFTARDLRRRL